MDLVVQTIPSIKKKIGDLREGLLNGDNDIVNRIHDFVKDIIDKISKTYKSKCNTQGGGNPTTFYRTILTGVYGTLVAELISQMLNKKYRTEDIAYEMILKCVTLLILNQTINLGKRCLTRRNNYKINKSPIIELLSDVPKKEGSEMEKINSKIEEILVRLNRVEAQLQLNQRRSATRSRARGSRSIAGRSGSVLAVK
jgi:hypothetical protein